MSTERGDVLRRALVELRELKARLEAQHEPIAIVGIGCRFPGGASSPERFWQLIEDGVDATGPVPPERWDAEARFDPDPDRPGRMHVRRGAFLDGVDGFDGHWASIFGTGAASATNGAGAIVFG